MFRGIFRAFSLSSTAESSTNFIAKRKVYRGDVSQLRKSWGQEFQIEAEREEQRKKAEKKQMILEKAMRLRERRKETLARQEAVRRVRESFLLKYREKLARNHLYRQKQLAAQEERYRKLVSDLEFEKDTWITSANMSEKITPDLFKTQCSTGLVHRSSELWRVHLISIKLDRVMSPEAIAEYTDSSLANRLNNRGHLKLSRKLMVEDFLSPMIGTGEERSKYKEIVKKFSHAFDQLGGFDEYDWYWEHMSDQLLGTVVNRTGTASKRDHESDTDAVSEISLSDIRDKM